MKKRTHIKPRTLAEWREQRSLSQRAAAKELGISQGYYGRLERHIQAPRRELLKALIEKTGLPIESLMGIAS